MPESLGLLRRRWSALSAVAIGVVACQSKRLEKAAGTASGAAGLGGANLSGAPENDAGMPTGGAGRGHR